MTGDGNQAPGGGMRVISAAEIEEALDYPSLIDCLRTAFQGDAVAPLRHQHTLPAPGGAEGIMLLKPVWRRGGPAAVKVVNVFPTNAERGLPAVLGAVLLFDGDTGAPVAVIDGQSLTVRRTAAASALAASYLAREDTASLLVVGTGQLAPALALAHAAVRPIRDVRVWGRSLEKAKRTAASLAAQGLPARPAEELEEAAAQADLITCATLAKTPLIQGGWLKPGVHLDLVGGFTPEMREADDEAVRRARVFVDTREGALAEAGDLTQPIANGAIAASDIAGELSELCRGQVQGRGSGDEITLFKSVGTALEDLAAAEMAAERT